MRQSQPPFQPRPIRYRGNRLIQDWVIKQYHLTAGQADSFAATADFVKDRVDDWSLESEPDRMTPTRMAILMVHDGVDGCYVVLSRWASGNMLQTRVWVRLAGEQVFKSLSDRGVWTCVWELEVLWHERNAWIRHVLMAPAAPDWNGYLNDSLKPNKENGFNEIG